MRRRVRITTLFVLGAIVAAIVLLSSCTSLRCVVGKHNTHGTHGSPIEPASDGWSAIDPVDGMTVYAKGDPSHPPVLLLHEMPGLLPETVEFADALVKREYRVYMPLFFGRFGHPASRLSQLGVCAGPSFNCLSGSESRVVSKLRLLRDRIANHHKEQGIGIIGMCLTGGMPLSLVNDRVAAIVLSQPGIPLPLTASTRHSLGVSDDSMAAAAKLPVAILAIRFAEDCLAPPERFVRLSQQIPPGRLETHIVPTENRRAHSVLTVEGQHTHEDPEMNEAVHAAIDHAFRFLDQHLKTGER